MDRMLTILVSQFGMRLFPQASVEYFRLPAVASDAEGTQDFLRSILSLGCAG